MEELIRFEKNTQYLNSYVNFIRYKKEDSYENLLYKKISNYENVVDQLFVVCDKLNEILKSLNVLSLKFDVSDFKYPIKLTINAIFNKEHSLDDYEEVKKLVNDILQETETNFGYSGFYVIPKSLNF